MDLEQKAFIVHIATFFVEQMKVHPDRKNQIITLITNKALVIVLAKYLDFADVFSKKSAVVLSEYIKINIHTINIEEDKQLFYELIFSLRSVELETLKTYIKTNLVNSFICLSKSLAGILILFNKKLNENLWLCVDY